jgi:hypothetical protein
MFRAFIYNASFTKSLDKMEACIMKRINFAAEQKIQIHQYMMRIKSSAVAQFCSLQFT